ncbi:MAG: VOC family protein [Calditrichaceae bacterium]
MSLQKNPVNWFEIPVNDLIRAKEFYEYVLGIELVLNETGPPEMAWFPGKLNGPGATGTLVKAKSYIPSNSGCMVYFAVDDLDDSIQRVQEKGGKILNSKMSIGEYGFVCHFEDSEGNRVALHSNE